MNPETLEALKASIAKWERNQTVQTAKEVDLGPSYCPLCKLFNTPEMTEIDCCYGCPVFEKTKKKCCRGTPYDDVEVSRFTSAKDIRSWAVKETEFLKSLLPTKVNPEKGTK